MRRLRSIAGAIVAVIFYPSMTGGLSLLPGCETDSCEVWTDVGYQPC